MTVTDSPPEQPSLARVRRELRQTPLRPMEDFAGRSLTANEAREQAAAVLRAGWVRGGSPPISLFEAIPWDQSAARNRSWSFHLHCWDILDACLLAYGQTPQSDLLQTSLRVAKDWIANFSAFRGSSAFAWYDMAVGVRGARLAFLIDAAARSEEVPDEDISLLLLSAEQHRAYLADDSNFAFHSNHGFYQAAGQAAMARRLSFMTGMEESSAQARMRVATMLDQQFSSEGVHSEHSPDYHRMVVRTLQVLLKSGVLDDPETVARYRACEGSLGWFVFPDGQIVNFGDSDWRQLSGSASQAETAWLTDPMRWAVSDGAAGSPESDEHKTFKESGYFVVRSRHDRAVPRQDSYLAMMAAYNSRTHKHADDLSLVWFERGAHILIDAGRYGYLEKTEPDSPLWKEGFWYGHPARVYCESTHAHNTVEIDGASYDRRADKPYGSAIIRAGREGDLFFSEGHVRHQRFVRHARTIVFSPRKWLLVADWLGDATGAKHDFTQWWHFVDGSASERLDETGWSVSIPSVSDPLHLRVVSPANVAVTKHEAESEPRLQGWWSPSDETLLPAPALGVRSTERLASVSLITLLSFDGNPSIVRSRVSASGRSLLVEWIDERGTNSLKLTRPSDPAKALGIQHRHAAP